MYFLCGRMKVSIDVVITFMVLFVCFTSKVDNLNIIAYINFFLLLTL